MHKADYNLPYCIAQHNQQTTRFEGKNQGEGEKIAVNL